MSGYDRMYAQEFDEEREMRRLVREQRMHHIYDRSIEYGTYAIWFACTALLIAIIALYAN